MAESVPTSSRPRVLSGMRPTGKLHLGNYMGALANWVKLQDQYECYFFIADWHALTTDYADPSRLKLNTLDVALDFLDLADELLFALPDEFHGRGAFPQLGDFGFDLGEALLGGVVVLLGKHRLLHQVCG